MHDWTGSAGSTTPSLVRRFVYAGHLLLLELDGSNQPVRKYTWGLDLAGQNGAQSSALPEALEAAGGILDNAAQCQGQVGGLLAVYDLNDTPGAEQTSDDLQYVHTYDGNGSVAQVLDWSASSAPDAIVATYEYDPYGNVVAQAGDYADRNPFRFSTKYWDDQTGLLYFGESCYSARMGRWISRYSEEVESDGANGNPYGWRGGWQPEIAGGSEGRVVLHQGYGYTDCDPKTGEPIVVVKEHCAGDCVKQHEQVHADGIRSCCKRYSLCVKRHGLRKCTARWNSWLRTNEHAIRGHHT